jgi:hypothetical protein
MSKEFICIFAIGIRYANPVKRDNTPAAINPPPKE